LKDPRSIPQ